MLEKLLARVLYAILYVLYTTLYFINTLPSLNFYMYILPYLVTNHSSYFRSLSPLLLFLKHLIFAFLFSKISITYFTSELVNKANHVHAQSPR
jgi:hypothetical protein